MTTSENPGLRSVFEAARRAVGLREGCAYADVVSGIRYLKVSSDARSAAVIRAERAEDELDEVIQKNDALLTRAFAAEAERDNATAALERMRLELVRVDEMVSRYSQSADAVSEDRARWMERYADLEAALREIEKEADLRRERHIAAIARRALGGGE